MINTKQKASVQSMNNDNSNLQAQIEGTCNTPGCKCINSNELYGKSIPIDNEMQHAVNMETEALPKLSIDMTCLRHAKRGCTALLNGHVSMWLPGAVDALWYLF